MFRFPSASVRSFGSALAAPQIRPSRNHLDNRFPVLAFTIQTGGRGFFEVLLTTDPALFGPGQEARRTTANLYSSRQEGGLLPAAGPTAVYMVPAAVLRVFAEAQPRPTALYYTVVAYGGADGSDPAPAMPPERLIKEAASVTLSPDFRGQTLSSILGIATHLLQRVHDSRSAPAPQAISSAISPAEDAAAGEDGFGREQSWHDPADVAEESFDYRDHQDDFAYDDGFADAPAPPWSAPLEVHAEQAVPEPLTDSDDYDPEPFEDDEFDSLGGASASGHALGRGRYADEADEYHWDSDVPPYQALDDPPARQPLQTADKLRIIERVAQFESAGAPYTAANRDGEFAGRFRNHAARGRYHIGLSFGIVQFTQDSGNLGKLLLLMRDRNGGREAAEFARIFGPHADELVRVTNAAGPSSAEVPGGRSARVQPVGGADLWEDAWVTRFQEAGRHPPFQAAQNELAARLFIDPMLSFCAWLELDTERALSVVVDRSVQMGDGGARKWIIGSVGPVQTAAQRQQALAALGFANLRAFQEATTSLTPDGDWGPMSHAALTAALRSLGGANSPVQVMSRGQMLDALVRSAHGQPWAHRVERLRNLTAPDIDVPYQLV